MPIVDNYRLKLGAKEFVPIVVGGMGVDISTDALALEACRLGGIGHISDAMAAFVSDKKYGTRYTKAKANRYKDNRDNLDKTYVKFDLADLREAQMRYVSDVISRKVGDGAVHINVMEKLGMGAPAETLGVRLNAALETHGLFDRRGKLRVAWLSKLESLMREARAFDQSLGLRRRPRHVSLDEYLKTTYAESPAAVSHSETGTAP